MAEAEKEWMKVRKRVNWSSGRQFSSRKFLQTEIFRLPASIAMRGYSTLPPFFLLRWNSQLSADNFPFWQHMFCFSWFFWLVARKHSGCLWSQWFYKLPTSNPLSMVCENVCTTSYYTNNVIHQIIKKSRTLPSLYNWLTYKLFTLWNMHRRQVSWRAEITP